MSPNDSAIREQLAGLLAWEDAHATYDAAVAELPAELRGRTPPGLPYSPWQLVEHLRITQHDLLDFCRNPDYHELVWPKDYWPGTAVPASAKAWEESLRRYREDRAALQALARDPAIELTARIPHGSGQTYLREILLAVDHAAYHIGELIVARRLLAPWTTG